MRLVPQLFFQQNRNRNLIFSCCCCSTGKSQIYLLLQGYWGVLEWAVQLKLSGSMDLLVCWKSWIKTEKTGLKRALKKWALLIQYLLFPGLVWRKENMFCPSLLSIFRTLPELSFIYHGFTSIIWYSFLQLPVWRFFSWKSHAEIKDIWNKIIDGFFIVSGAVVLAAKRQINEQSVQEWTK